MSGNVSCAGRREPLDLEGLRRLERAATKGPWQAEVHGDLHYCDGRPVDVVVTSGDKLIAKMLGDATTFAGLSRMRVPGPNGCFIATARTALPALLDEVKRLRKALSDAEQSATFGVMKCPQCHETALILLRARKEALKGGGEIG